MQSLGIITLCLMGSVVYGIVHNQITVRVCVEYFTIGHPPLFHTQSPTLLGLLWGIVATWWGGAILGVALAAAARAGSRPRQQIRDLLAPLGILLIVMAICAALAGLVGFWLAQGGAVFLIEPLASAVPREKHLAFIANLWAHSASYVAGFGGGLIVAIRVWRLRMRDVATGRPTN